MSTKGAEKIIVGPAAKGAVHLDATVNENLKAIATAASGTLNDAVKVTIFLTDLAHFPKVNEVMAQYFAEPYPARAAVGVAQLPRGAQVEIECVLQLT